MSDTNANPTGARRPKPGDWRADAAAPGGRGKLIAATLFLMTAVAGVAVGFLVFYTKAAREPLLVSVPVGEYKHPAWPANPWADRDADVLSERFRRRGDQPLAFKAFNFQNAPQFRLLLEWIAGRGAVPPNEVQADVAGRPLVLHVTALAVVRNGVVYLLPGDAEPAAGSGAPPAWVPVDTVLDAVAESAAPRKLVLLDLAHPVADPFGGVLRNDVAAGLDALLKARLAAGKLPFPVLTSCGPGELSRPADPARCSAFALYVADGMRGLADGYNADNYRDGQVSAAELAQFVAARVSRYARMVHDRRQTATLYPPSLDGADFPLTYEVTAAEEYPAGVADLFPPALEQGWQTRDAGRAAGADRGAPVAFARLTRGLLRTEQEWRWAGGDARAGRVEGKWADARTEWNEALGKSGGSASAADIHRRAVEVVGRFRLAAARAGRPPVPADWVAAFDQYLTARLASPPRPDEAAKLRQAWLDKAAANPLDAAWVVWDRARRESAPDRKAVAAWAEAADEVGPMPTFAEVLLLRALAKRDFRLEQGLATFPATAVAALVQAEHELGLSVAASPEGFGLVAGAMSAAEADRQEGVKALYAAGLTGGARAQLDRAEELLRRAGAGFREARDTLARWQEANRTWEAAVPAVHDALPAAVARNRPAVDDCERAADDAARLAARLGEAVRSGRFDPASVAQEVRAVQEATARLRAPFDPAAVKKVVESGPRARPIDLDPLYQLVEATAVPAAERKKVWDAIRTETAKLHDNARASDAADDAAKAPTAAPNQSATADPEGDIAPRRVRASLALLRLAGYEKVAALDTEARRLDADPAAVGDRLRAAWVTDLPDAARAAAAGKVFVAERVARAYPPQAGPAGDFPPGLFARRAADDVKAYRGWVHGQLLADKPYRSGVPGGEAFYPAVADLAPN